MKAFTNSVFHVCMANNLLLFEIFITIGIFFYTILLDTLFLELLSV